MSLCAFHIAQCALWTLPCALGTVAHGAPPGHATNCLLYTLHTAAPTPHIRQCCPDGGAVHCSLWTTLALHCVLSTWRTALCGRCPAHGARAMSRPLTGGRPVAREKHMWTRHEMAGRQYASSGQRGGKLRSGGVESNCEKLRENCGKIAKNCGKLRKNCGKIAMS